MWALRPNVDGKIQLTNFHTSGMLTEGQETPDKKRRGTDMKTNSSMGSLGIPPIYHHLYDFGNLPIFLAFGAKRRENFMLPDGTVQQKKYIDFTVTTDERICDGFYFASSIKFMKRCLANPERLDEKPESVVRDVD